MTHRCPVAGCGIERPAGKLMCFVHWRLVPPELQRDVWRTWRAASRSDHRTVSGRCAWDAYERASQTAIDAVNRAVEACA